MSKSSRTLQLRSLSAGQGQFSMTLREYYPVPERIQSALIARC